jgi:hypothetical protein
MHLTPVPSPEGEGCRGEVSLRYENLYLLKKAILKDPRPLYSAM